MKRSFSGIQPSGNIHLGNYLGAIKQHIDLQNTCEGIYFIADLHSLTTVRDPDKLRQQTFDILVTYLALGFDPEKSIIFRQSEISEHTELFWILDCLTSVPFLERAHAWKDAKEKGKKEPTAGLLNYPVLMAADILLYSPDLVPVGQDQKQHVEIARDIAQSFNSTFGETFKLPEPLIKDEVKTVPGTDGQKMSKSYGNTIEIFAPESTIKKQVMGIVTDSTPVENPKDPQKCNIFGIYKLLANKEEIKELESKYRAGGFGYGEAKKILLAKILEYFADAREKYDKLHNQKDFIYEILEEGNKKAKNIAGKMMETVRKKVGLR